MNSREAREALSTTRREPLHIEHLAMDAVGRERPRRVGGRRCAVAQWDA